MENPPENIDLFEQAIKYYLQIIVTHQPEQSEYVQAFLELSKLFLQPVLLEYSNYISEKLNALTTEVSNQVKAKPQPEDINSKINSYLEYFKFKISLDLDFWAVYNSKKQESLQHAVLLIQNQASDVQIQEELKKTYPLLPSEIHIETRNEAKRVADNRFLLYPPQIVHLREQRKREGEPQIPAGDGSLKLPRNNG